MQRYKCTNRQNPEDVELAKNFDIEWDDVGCVGYMEPVDEGEWVRWDDVEELIETRMGDMVSILNGFVLNRRHIKTEEPFEGSLSRLIDMAEAIVSTVEGTK